jgi:hypothetical protein
MWQLIFFIFYFIIGFFWIMIIIINIIYRSPKLWKIKKYIIINNYLNDVVIRVAMRAMIYILVILYLVIYRIINKDKYKDYSIDLYYFFKYNDSRQLFIKLIILIIILVIIITIFVKLDLNTSFIYLHYLLLPLYFYETFVLYVLKIFIPYILKYMIKNTDKMIKKGRLTLQYYIEEIIFHFCKYLIPYFVIMFILHDFYIYGIGVIGNFLYYLPFVLLINLIYRFISFYIALNLRETGWYFEYYKIIYQLKLLHKMNRIEKFVYVEFDL